MRRVHSITRNLFTALKLSTIVQEFIYNIEKVLQFNTFVEIGTSVIDDILSVYASCCISIIFNTISIERYLL